MTRYWRALVVDDRARPELGDRQEGGRDRNCLDRLPRRAGMKATAAAGGSCSRAGSPRWRSSGSCRSPSSGSRPLSSRSSAALSGLVAAAAWPRPALVGRRRGSLDDPVLGLAPSAARPPGTARASGRRAASNARAPGRGCRPASRARTRRRLRQLVRQRGQDASPRCVAAAPGHRPSSMAVPQRHQDGSSPAVSRSSEVAKRVPEALAGLGQPDARGRGARTRSSLPRSSRGGLTAPATIGSGRRKKYWSCGLPARAVGDHQRRLAAAAGPAAALGVVGRRRRHVAQVDGVEVGDVDAQLHRRRAEQHRQLARAEPVLALLPRPRRRHLAGVLAGLQCRGSSRAPGLRRSSRRRRLVRPPPLAAGAGRGSGRGTAACRRPRPSAGAEAAAGSRGTSSASPAASTGPQVRAAARGRRARPSMLAA